MKSPDDLDLAAELRAIRPTPRPEFAAELDARAAAGFPGRRQRDHGIRHRAATAGGRIADRLRISPRRLLAPTGGLAIAAVIAATVVVVNTDSGSRTSILNLDSGRGGGGAEAGEAMQPGYSTERPGAERLLEPSSSSAGTDKAAAASGTALPPEELAPGDTGPYASHTDRRAVERSAEMTLATEPADVRRAAGKVFESVHAYDGIVLESSIEDGGEGEAGASFELLIPSGKLGDALASFSSIAEVRSRHEATADVTAKTVGLGERLQDGRATVESLLAQLAAADSDAERAAAEAELRSERLRVAALRSRLADLQRRANLSQVSLKIETGDAGAPAPDENGSWGIGDALGDAGQILEVAAGITLIGLAILSPIALLFLLIWLSRRTAVRRGRERALG
ncbi:MAG TPA: DUF4349 domain-containing protein [Solirubrobacterales bacterium]|jgi:hypothetical protein|nr:DUF4349 domain-containing protein [Solirubrobacterales bacterium]